MNTDVFEKIKALAKEHHEKYDVHLEPCKGDSCPKLFLLLEMGVKCAEVSINGVLEIMKGK